MYTYTNLKADGIYVIIAVKNQEEKIEGFLRSTLFKIFYGKEETIKNIIVADLNSTDKTKEIVDKISEDYECIKTTKWKECKEIIDNPSAAIGTTYNAISLIVSFKNINISSIIHVTLIFLTFFQFLF